MTAVDLATTNQRTTDKPRQRLSSRIKRALDLMIWDGMTDNDAAVQSGITVTNIRLCLKQPHVRAYYHEGLKVLRERESSRNIHVLTEVRDQKTNQMARVQAVKALEEMGDELSTGRRSQFNASPGLVVNIISNGDRVALTAHERAIDVHSPERPALSRDSAPLVRESGTEDD